MMLDDDRRGQLEREIARLDTALAGVANDAERRALVAQRDDLRARLERLEFAIEIERQSDA